MRKQFKDIDIYAGIKAQDGAKWIKDNGIVENWKTPEHIEVRPVYTKEDHLPLGRRQGIEGESGKHRRHLRHGQDPLQPRRGRCHREGSGAAPS